jgi:uncharacterized repeat protein (TIGR03803 family)
MKPSALAARERGKEEVMTSSRTNAFNPLRFLGMEGALLLALWLTTATASIAQTFNTIADFEYTNGERPMGLVQATNGNFYGVTFYGGANNGDLCEGVGCGTFFEMTTAGALTTFYSFCSQTNCTDGFFPQAAPVQGTDGNFYGITLFGGGYGCGRVTCGTVFKVTAGGKLKTLHRFGSSRDDGSLPEARLVQTAGGTFYGTTCQGGAVTFGTFFKITSAGKLEILHSFTGGKNSGKCPWGIVQGADGNFYGVTTEGGGSAECQWGCGVVFKITPAGKLTALHDFGGPPDGARPEVLIQGADGNFYGTTTAGGAYGGDNGDGTVFQITPEGVLTILHSFNLTDGAEPTDLIQGSDGNFYGTTIEGGGGNGCFGNFDCGTIFQITPTGTLTTLHSFCPNGWPNCPDGYGPYGMIQDTDGNFYGTTGGGGDSSACSPAYEVCGTAYKLSMGLGPFVTFVLNSGKVGSKAEILGQGLTGTTAVSFNGTAANFVVQSDTYLTASVPQGATTGYVTVTTPGGILQSKVVFRVTK